MSVNPAFNPISANKSFSYLNYVIVEDSHFPVFDISMMMAAVPFFEVDGFLDVQQEVR